MNEKERFINSCTIVTVNDLSVVTAKYGIDIIADLFNNRDIPVINELIKIGCIPMFLLDKLDLEKVMSIMDETTFNRTYINFVYMHIDIIKHKLMELKDTNIVNTIFDLFENSLTILSRILRVELENTMTVFKNNPNSRYIIYDENGYDISNVTNIDTDKYSVKIKLFDFELENLLNNTITLDDHDICKCAILDIDRTVDRISEGILSILDMNYITENAVKLKIKNHIISRGEFICT